MQTLPAQRMLLMPLIARKAINSDGVQWEEEVHEVLDAWYRSAANEDFESYIGALKEDAIVFGALAEERWTRSEFEEAARSFLAPGYQPVSRQLVFQNGTGAEALAWVDELLETREVAGNGPFSGDATWRGITLLVQDPLSGSWKIASHSLSATQASGKPKDLVGPSALCSTSPNGDQAVAQMAPSGLANDPIEQKYTAKRARKPPSPSRTPRSASASGNHQAELRREVQALLAAPPLPARLADVSFSPRYAASFTHLREHLEAHLLRPPGGAQHGASGALQEDLREAICKLAQYESGERALTGLLPVYAPDTVGTGGDDPFPPGDDPQDELAAKLRTLERQRLVDRRRSSDRCMESPPRADDVVEVVMTAYGDKVTLHGTEEQLQALKSFQLRPLTSLEVHPIGVPSKGRAETGLLNLGALGLDDGEHTPCVVFVPQ
eukprot:gene5959-7163_t